MNKINHAGLYKITASILRELRSSLTKHGFNEILPAILSERFEPGAKHSVAVLGNFKVPKIDLVSLNEDDQISVSGLRYYYLPVSHAVEKQIALEYSDKVYCLAPCVRLVMPGEEISGRHLYTFFQVEIEWRTESIEDVFTTAEKIIFDFAASMLLNNDLTNSIRERLGSLCTKPYPRLTFNEAIQMVRGKIGGGKIEDLTTQEEEELCRKFKAPVWVYSYPEGVRDSLYRRNEMGLYDTYELLLPYGHGELSTGGLRPESYDEIIRQSKLLGKELHPSYAEWKKNTNVQTAGFGIGLERLIRFIGCYDSILDTKRYHDSGPNTLIKVA